MKYLGGRILGLAISLAAGTCAPARDLFPAAEMPRGITLVSSPNLARWLPEGSADGNELVPSLPDKDLIFHCQWNGKGPARTLFVVLVASNYTGCCSNAGTLKCADLTIEADRNPAWRVIGPDIPEYPGLQSSNVEKSDAVTACTSAPVESGVLVELRVSCYDWGGHALLRVYAEGCDPAIIK